MTRPNTNLPVFGVRNSLARRAALRVLRTVNPGDITIRHHWTGAPLRLHSFKHKGYWWHGKRRERATIERFYKLIGPGDTVIEVGGHIGYFAMLYASLVGPSGAVRVFEPGENNLPYLRRNLANMPHVAVIEEAVSNQAGEVTFWLEDLSGQNNSIIEDYYLLEGNIALAGLDGGVTKRAVHVPCTTLDIFARSPELGGRAIDFIKIDVEGAELLVLQGAATLLATTRPAMMVEVTREAEPIFELLQKVDYRLSLADGTIVTRAEQMNGNIFCLPDDAALEKFR
jgi:FkbM family methyltransferase